LGVKPASKLKLINDHAEDLHWLEVGVLCKGKEPHDFIHLFAKNRNVVQTEMTKLLLPLKLRLSFGHPGKKRAVVFPQI